MGTALQIREQAPNSGPRAAAESGRYLTFAIAGEVYAMGLLDIIEIMEFRPLTVVPMLPSFIRGVINLRGRVVPVVDMAARFGLGTTDVARRTSIIIVDSSRHRGPDGKGGGQNIGIMVDAVNKVVHLGAEDIEPPPAFGAGIRTDFISGMAKCDGSFMIILDVTSVLSLDEMAQLGQVRFSTAQAGTAPATATPARDAAPVAVPPAATMTAPASAPAPVPAPAPAPAPAGEAPPGPTGGAPPGPDPGPGAGTAPTAAAPAGTTPAPELPSQRGPAERMASPPEPRAPGDPHPPPAPAERAAEPPPPPPPPPPAAAPAPVPAAVSAPVPAPASGPDVRTSTGPPAATVPGWAAVARASGTAAAAGDAAAGETAGARRGSEVVRDDDDVGR